MPKVTTGIPRFTEDSSQKDDETEESITDDGHSSLTGSTQSKVSSLTLYDGVASYKTFSSGQVTPVHEPNNNNLDLPDINDGKSGLALSMGSGNYYLQMATSEHVFVNSGKKEIPIENEEDQNETSPTQRKIIFVVMATMDFVGGVIFSMIGPFYPIEAVDRGSDAFTAGVVMGVLQLAIFVASPIWGSQMTRLGARFTYLSGVFFSAGCVALFGLLTGCPHNLFIPMSLLVRFFQGVGCAAYMTATYSILVYNYPGRIATVIGVLETMNGLGFMIGPVIGGVLYQMGGFPTPFFVMAVLSLAVGFSISPIVPKNIGEKQHRKSRNMSLMSLLKIPLILLCGGLHATTAAIVGTLDATLALYLEQFKLPAYLTGFIFICGPGAYVICVPLWGYITDRFSTYRMSFVIVGFTVCACSLLLAGPAPFLPIEPKWVKPDYVAKNHQPGPCHHVQGIENGSEDMQIATEGLVLITSGGKFVFDHTIAPWKDIKGQILLYDFNQPNVSAMPVPISGKDFDEVGFNPHGISIWTDKDTGVITVFVVNHNRNRNEEGIEKFIFDANTRTLEHIETITDDNIIYLNDVVPMSNSTFYTTNYRYYPYNSMLRDMEVYGMMHLGYVLYYDGQNARIVDDNFFFANGINKSPDAKYLYVMHLGQEQLLTYEIQSDFSLQLVQTYPMDTLGDNIDIDENGDLWLGAHPSFDQITKSFEDLSLISASQVIKLTTKDGLITDIFEPWADDGSVLSHATTAIHYKKQMLVGSVTGKALLCDIVYY